MNQEIHKRLYSLLKTYNKKIKHLCIYSDFYLFFLHYLLILLNHETSGGERRFVRRFGTKIKVSLAFAAASATSRVLWQVAESSIKKASFKSFLRMTGSRTLLKLNLLKCLIILIISKKLNLNSLYTSEYTSLLMVSQKCPIFCTQPTHFQARPNSNFLKNRYNIIKQIFIEFCTFLPV